MEGNIFQKLNNLKERLDEFYSVEQVEFVSNQNEVIVRDLAYVKNPSDLILHIIRETEINPCVGFLRVPFDGGGGFLKIIVNVFEEEKEPENKFKNSRVQKVLIIAIVEDIPEKYENLRLVLEKLNLEDVNYYIVFDLKCADVLFITPELHLLIGAVDKIAGFLLTDWDGFELWLKEHHIIKKGYHGVGWDSNNANKILKLIDKLQLEVQLKVPYLLPVAQSLRTFKSVKEACFGRKLDSDSEQKLSIFRDAFLCLQETTSSLENTLTMSWKIHIIYCHVFPFVKHAGCGLSKYAEQCGEAILAKFKPKWQRYKRSIDHRDYRDRLKTTVVDFGIKRL